MARRPREQSKSGYYHIMLRGTGKMILFEDQEDYLVFLHKLEAIAAKRKVTVIAYCLMSNHLHIVVYDHEKHLSVFMQSLAVSHAMHFNEKSDHPGHVFAGRFLSVPIESDAQLLQAVRYVHQNPLKAGLCKIEEYEWSSYHAYLGESSFIDTHTVLAMHGNTDAFVAFTHQPGTGYSVPAFDRARLTDAEARKVLNATLTESDQEDLHGDSRQRRDAALRKLRDAGIGAKQTVRLTGLGKSIVSRAFSHTDVPEEPTPRHADVQKREDSVIEHTSERIRASDAKAKRIANATLTVAEWDDLKDDSPSRRDRALRKLRDAGLNVAQTVRLTGLGKSIVSRAFSHTDVPGEPTPRHADVHKRAKASCRL